jgi:RNA polymerase sigma factor (sigma-70 family)
LIWARITKGILRTHRSHWEDANQEAWLRVWHKLPKWKGGTLAAFVQSTVVNRLIDYRRRIKESQPLPNESLVDKATENSIHPMEQQEQAIRDEQCLACFQKTLESLPDEDRRIMEMKKNGIPDSQIQQELGLKHRTFYYRLRKIRDKLFECLDED